MTPRDAGLPGPVAQRLRGLRDAGALRAAEQVHVDPEVAAGHSLRSADQCVDASTRVEGRPPSARRGEPTQDFDFERLWRTYSRRSPNGHFAVFSRAQGWDLNVVATPPLAKGLAATPVLPCEAAYDAFPWLRMKRHGVWPPIREPHTLPPSWSHP